jgi:uncharacterized protein YndB with AHSA1/START domain
MMTSPELSRIDRTIEINASPARVWLALTNAADLSAWFHVTIEGKVAPDAEVWMTSVHPEHGGQRFLVRFAEMIPPRRIVWEWHPGEVNPNIDYSREPWTTVTFTLEPSAGGTRLSVAEEVFEVISVDRRAKVYQDNSDGWSIVVVWLKTYVEKQTS